MYTYAGIAGVVDSMLSIFIMKDDNMSNFFFSFAGCACVSFLLLLTVFKH
jgi:hypothetical protein